MHHDGITPATLTSGSTLDVELPLISVLCHTYSFRLEASNTAISKQTDDIAVKVCNCNFVTWTPPSILPNDAGQDYHTLVSQSTFSYSLPTTFQQDRPSCPSLDSITVEPETVQTDIQNAAGDPITITSTLTSTGIDLQIP